MFKLASILLSKIGLIFIFLFIYFLKPSLAIELNTNLESENNLKTNLSKESYIPILRIYSPSSPGSGVVIGKKNNIYTLITAKHVIGDFSVYQKDEIEIEIAPNIFVSPLKVIIPFEDKDLAVLRFQSNLPIKLAILPFLDKPLWEKKSNWEYINVQGFANQSSGIKEATFRKSSGSLLALIKNNVDGYNLIHTSPTTTGMSGGGIFSNALGELHNEVKPQVVDPEAETLVYYYDSLSEITKRVENHFLWLDKYQDQILYGSNFTEPFWDESIHSKAQNATYKKCMTNKWLPKKDVLEKSNKEFFEEFPYSDFGILNLTDPKISKLGLWKRCIDLAQKSDAGYNCKSFSDWQGKNDMYILLAIHGRAEKYAYGGKSGAGLGIFLGEGEIAKWLEDNANSFGILQDYSFAKRSCSHK